MDWWMDRWVDGWTERTCQHWWDEQDWQESCARVLPGPAAKAHWMPIKKYNHRSDKYHGCQQRNLIFFLTLTNSSLMSNIRSSNSVLLKDKRVTVIFSSTQLLSTFKIHETCFSGFFLPRLSLQTKQKRNVKIFPTTLKIQTSDICAQTQTNRIFQKLEQELLDEGKKPNTTLRDFFVNGKPHFPK